jgi:hypothetical protein
MVSSGSGPRCTAPVRPFPAKVWLAKRYTFLVSPTVFARLRIGPPASGRRFPAQVWLEARRGSALRIGPG